MFARVLWVGVTLTAFLAAALVIASTSASHRFTTQLATRYPECFKSKLVRDAIADAIGSDPAAVSRNDVLSLYVIRMRSSEPHAPGVLLAVAADTVNKIVLAETTSTAELASILCATGNAGGEARNFPALAGREYGGQWVSVVGTTELQELARVYVSRQEGMSGGSD